MNGVVRSSKKSSHAIGWPLPCHSFKINSLHWMNSGALALNRLIRLVVAIGNTDNTVPYLDYLPRKSRCRDMFQNRLPCSYLNDLTGNEDGKKREYKIAIHRNKRSSSSVSANSSCGCNKSEKMTSISSHHSGEMNSNSRTSDFHEVAPCLLPTSLYG